MIQKKLDLRKSGGSDCWNITFEIEREFWESASFNIEQKLILS